MEKKLNAQVLYGGTPRCGKSIRQYHCLNCDKKMLNKICLNCKYMGYKINVEKQEQIEFCLKRKVMIDEFSTCKEFEFE